MDKTTRIYAVSSGNGNDGVSRLFPDYYVKTNEPYRLAELAAISTFKVGMGQAWCQRNVDIDGEAEYGITACLLNPPCEDSPDGEYPDLGEEENESAEDGRNYSENKGAWQLWEITPLEEGETPRDGTPYYESLEKCFDAAELALVAKESQS